MNWIGAISFVCYHCSSLHNSPGIENTFSGSLQVPQWASRENLTGAVRLTLCAWFHSCDRSFANWCCIAAVSFPFLGGEIEQASVRKSAPGVRKIWGEVGSGWDRMQAVWGENSLHPASLYPVPYFSRSLAVSFSSRALFGNTYHGAKRCRITSTQKLTKYEWICQ